MRSNFDRQLETLNAQLTEKASLIESAIETASDALINSDKEKA